MAAAFLCRRSATRLNWALGIRYCQAAARPSAGYSIQHSLVNISRPSVSSPYWWPASAISDRPRLLNTESVKQPEDETQFEDTGMEKAKYTYHMEFLSETSYKAAPCYRILDDHGHQIAGTDLEEVDKEFALKMYSNMVSIQIMDTIFYEAQRQGRFSFYMASIGEEAVGVGSAAALNNEDVVFAQYRETGVLFWRGFTMQEFANQCFGNQADYGKGRQMPVHYGSSALNYFTISSPLATQIPQAVGAAYSLKMDGKQACAVAYFGDGAASEGDFHAALNFAAVMDVPIIFICRNNGWAISTPASEQFRSDGLVVRGPSYGIRSIRVDGNDALAVYSAIKTARSMAIEESKPILVEAMTYRVSHHSTSDDSARYRRLDEVEYWKGVKDPITRFRKWLNINGWWSDADELPHRTETRNKVVHALECAERLGKPPLCELFSDVYDIVPSNLKEQENHLRHNVALHPQDFPHDVPH
jgi:2-oxoisovalerate dehydrogenase E1 component alpha subunit